MVAMVTGTNVRHHENQHYAWLYLRVMSFRVWLRTDHLTFLMTILLFSECWSSVLTLPYRKRMPIFYCAASL